MFPALVGTSRIGGPINSGIKVVEPLTSSTRSKRWLRPSLDKVKDYFLADLGTLFIIAFLVLLCFAALRVALGDETGAELVAVYAFFVLLGGVAIQIDSIVREERKRSRTARSENA